MNLVQRTTVALDLLFGAVARSGPAEHERVQAVVTDGHAFYPIGRLHALNRGGVAERLEDMW